MTTGLLNGSLSLAQAALPQPTAEPISMLERLAQLPSSPLDHMVMAALLGATAALIFINIAQAMVRHEALNLWLALYIGALSVGIAIAWSADQDSTLWLTAMLPRKTFCLIATCAQAIFVYRFATLPRSHNSWNKLFIGLNMGLFAAGIVLLTSDLVNSHRAMRLLFFIGTGLCVVHLALSMRQQTPYATHLLFSKAILVSIAIVSWWPAHRFAVERPLYYWLSQSLIILECMVVTYALVMINIEHFQQRLHHHFERGAKLKLKKQYNQTLKRIDNELRTPLSGVVGIAELLLDTSLTKNQRDQIVTMRRASESLLKWLNRLNDWRALQIGRLTFDAIPFDFSHLLNTLCEDLKVKAEDRKVTLDYTPHSNTPTLIKGDPARLKQIISGTLEMALFYSEQGNISIHLKPGSQRNQWLLEINDDQSGLHAEDIQISLCAGIDNDAEQYSSVQRNWLIAQTLARHTGGQLSVQLDQGQALFTCELMLTRYSLLQHHENQYDKLLQDKRLLVVDDSSSSRKVVAKRADSWGMKTTCVPSGDDALAMIHTMSQLGGGFDVIILDYDMPNMTGYELAQHISRNIKLTHQPIMIMLSGANTPPTEELGRGVGIKRVLTKPISAKSLKITMAEELTLHQAQQRNRSHKQPELLEI